MSSVPRHIISVSSISRHFQDVIFPTLTVDDVQGAITAQVPETDVKVTNADSPDPTIELTVKDQSTPAMQLVAEMMIMCGEAIASIGEENRLSLPYRGQAQTDYGSRELSNVPDGPCRAFATRRLLGAVDMSSTRKMAHASLGLPGYVQFTSPIRRYGDLIAHYQVHSLGSVSLSCCFIMYWSRCW